MQVNELICLPTVLCITYFFEGKRWGKTGKIKKTEKENKKEPGLVVSQQTLIRNQAELSEEKNEKELGRTDRKFGISRSKSPYPQILVPNGPL